MGINRRDENTIYKPFDGVTQLYLQEKKQVQKCFQLISMN